ncbi:aminotransferase class I/II-fold pyridoxal phosphate-dependent enzyme [Bacillus sp. NPDC077027]|uniref:aminotransferase class I/II-fold pyridoxal phosphate-dependent enzyme n=1 Tax=Bacillus sp. NPDC077027 TaxID=3390548 RepID=UPI003D06D010
MKTPLYTALTQHAEKRPYSFHVPGHHNGDVFFDEARPYFAPLLQLDVTELEGLDDLHHPTGIIQEAEALLAQLYGARMSFFLVNGTTVGNLAMVMATCNKGDEILVQRNCHKSIFHAIELAGATPVFLETELDQHLQVSTHVSEKTVTTAIAKHPNSKVIVFTYPNYYGHSVDLTRIIQICHDAGLLVLVDEAHGAHFILGEGFPPSALSYGADVVVQSAHKTLPAMTMGSFLHIQHERVDGQKIKTMLTMLQSSSPSYPIMASLDVARAFVEKIKTEGQVEQVISRVKRQKEQLLQIPHIELVEPEHVKTDPLKCCIRSTKGLSGYELKRVLESVEVHPELADEHQVLLIFSLGEMKPFPVEIVKQALESSHSLLAQHESGRDKVRLIETDLLLQGMEVVTFDEAVNRISAESVIPYPPGIPLILKGERIEVEQIEKLNRLLHQKVHVQGNSVIFQQQLYVYIEEETL